MSQNIIVWDIESVPDRQRFAIANDLVGQSDSEIREHLGDKFPKHIYHSIICIGALLAHRETSQWKIDAIGAPHIGGRTEKALISAFVARIAEPEPQLVTLNGNSFDLPVLRYRAMVNEVAAPGLSARPYFNRYSEDAVDLCDVLASFSHNARTTLDAISRAMGFLASQRALVVARLRATSFRVASRKLPTIANLMWSILTASGRAMNYFADDSQTWSTGLARLISLSSSRVVLIQRRTSRFS